MALASKITYLSSREIEKEKWDHCIRHASNGLIYGYSCYLDAMADHWDGLILNDYEMVMPLPWRKKFGIHYIYQPYFIAQLGLFGSGITAELLTDFLSALPNKFKYLELSFNHQNNFPDQNIPGILRSNYVLGLEKSYEDLSSVYRENIKRNIKKSASYGCELRKDIDVDDVIRLSKLQAVNEKIDPKNFDRFHLLFQYLKERNQAKTYGIMGRDGQLLSSCVFFFSHNRAYYILVGNHPNGRTLGASHALIDAFIKDHAGQSLLLDFEGSDIRNLAFFYNSFGATEEVYPFLRINRLPFYLKWLKA